MPQSSQFPEATEAELEIIRLGEEAVRPRVPQTFNNWLRIGHALDVGRRIAMRTAYTTRTQGFSYNAAFNRWLAQHPGLQLKSSTAPGFTNAWITSRKSWRGWRRSPTPNISTTPRPSSSVGAAHLRLRYQPVQQPRSRACGRRTSSLGAGLRKRELTRPR
jgi:hypothetical protein